VRQYHQAGRPVKVTMTQAEVFEATGSTSDTQVRVKLGATTDGRLVAGEAHLIYETGAFPGSPMASACQGMMSPYDMPHICIEDFERSILVMSRTRSRGAPRKASARPRHAPARRHHQCRVPCHRHTSGCQAVIHEW
jgi:hypothetical protein